MRTILEPGNPFGPSRYGFAWQHIERCSLAHLDFGCGDGMFLASLANKGIGRLVGADVPGAISQAVRSHPDLDFAEVLSGQRLKFDDETFDSITMLDVLEHLDDQRGALCELKRVLKRSGLLIITVPRKHVFSILDLGNLKFRFPRLHRWWYLRRGSLADYRRRYVENPDGLVGDVSAGKGWHEHFSQASLGALLAGCGFAVEKIDGTGLFARPLYVLSLLVKRIGPLSRLIRRLRLADNRAFSRANLFCVARRL